MIDFGLGAYNDYVMPVALVIVIIVGYYLWTVRGSKKRRQTVNKPPSEHRQTREEKALVINQLLKKEIDERLPSPVVVGDPIRARVYDNILRSAYMDTIPASTVATIKEYNGSLGRRWMREGEWVYALNKTTEGNYVPVYPSFDMDFQPTKVHRALMQQEVAICYDMKMPQNFMEKYGKILVWSGIIVFIMFLAVRG
jgi:hypothetical protein